MTLIEAVVLEQATKRLRAIDANLAVEARIKSGGRKRSWVPKLSSPEVRERIVVDLRSICSTVEDDGA
jgi:hypothetical protein